MNWIIAIHIQDKEGFANKVYKAGQGIMENMNAEERLMRNIPKGAAKVCVMTCMDVVYAVRAMIQWQAAGRADWGFSAAQLAGPG